MATIADVAYRAGVGVGTVSRVINGGAGVRPATRQRVQGAIDALGFRPSPAARALSRRRASTIGVVAPFLTRPSVVERLRGVVAALDATEYDLSLATVEIAEQRERRMGEVAQRDRVDGAILISLRPTGDEAARLRDSGAPVIVLDADGAGLPSLVTDDVAGGRLAGEHLLQLGHRRIGFVGEAPDERFGFTSSADRLAGMGAALDAAGTPLDPGLVVLGGYGRAEAAALVAPLLALPHPPTAIFAPSDTQALGIIDAAEASGLEVPADLSVVGFDDIELAAFAGLTTVRQHLQDTGRRAAELLLATIGGAVPAPATTLPIDLIPRRSTGRPRRRPARSARPRRRRDA